MASINTTVAIFLVLALFEPSLGTVHKVGDATGWTIMGGVDYNTWSSSKKIHIGDSLLFQYDEGFHDVTQVNHKDYQSCNAASPVATYTSGSDSINLKRAGHYYFLCSVPGHCQTGMKIDVLVTPPSLRPTASPAPAPHGSAAPSRTPIDVEPPSSAKSSAPSRYLPLLLLAIIAVAFYVSVFA